MLEWITVGTAALKSASGVIKDLRSIKTDAAVAEKAIELNGLILDIQEQFMAAQAERAALAAKVDSLQAELAAKNNWENEKAKYQPHTFETGSLAYALISDGDAPQHFICPNCYEDGQRRILQPINIKGGKGLKCPRCTTEILIKPLRITVDLI